MIVWRCTAEENAMPPWLEGCENVQAGPGKRWWAGPPGVVPAGGLEYIKCGKNYEAALCGDPEVNALIRNPRYTIPDVLEDARGNRWALPRILGPDGTPVVARVRKLLPDGTWQRTDVDDLQREAIEACKAVRNQELDEDEQTACLLALLEVTYHCNAATFGVLGLVDDVLVSVGLRFAAGILEEPED